MPSMKDVATLANVSVSTVSRVISGSMKVEEDTKQRVLDAIKAIGYKPNLVAQGLRSKSSKMIGLVVPEIAHPSFVNIIKFTEESVAERDLNLVICNTNNDYEKSAIAFDQLIRRNINGIILSRVSDESQVLNIVSNNDIPVVVIDRSLDHESIPNIILDNHRAGCMAAEHLINSGRKKLVCVTGKLNILLSRSRLNGFRDTLNNYGITLPKHSIFEGEFSFQAGQQAVDYIINNKIDVDGIWCQSDLIAIGLITALQRAGINVPEDIAVVGMDDIQQSSMMFPTITTIAQPYKDMCFKAVEIIDDLSEGKAIDKNCYMFQPELIIRESAP